MKKSKFTMQQIILVLYQAETVVKVSKVCRKMGIRKATLYNLKKKYGGSGVSELRSLHQLKDENNKLKQIVADLSLDKQILQGGLYKALVATQKRYLINQLVQDYRYPSAMFA